MHQEVRAGTCSNHTALRQTLTPAFELQTDYTCNIRPHLQPGWNRGCACMEKRGRRLYSSRRHQAILCEDLQSEHLPWLSPSTRTHY